MRCPMFALLAAALCAIAERLAGLSLVWSTARDHFAWFDHAPDLDWDRAYVEAIPRVLAAPDTAAYYRELRRFVALLRDGHSNVYAPRPVAALDARPGLRTALIEGRVLVIEVLDAALATRGLRVGDELLEVDGLDVHRHVELNIAPFQSVSTPQDLVVRGYSYDLLLGPAAQPVRLRLRHADGAAYGLEAPRTGFERPPAPPSERFQLRDDGIAVLTTRQFGDDAAAKLLEREIDKLFAAKGLIIDLRGHGGGSSSVGWDLLSWLSAAPIETPLSLVRDGDPYRRAQDGDKARISWRALSRAPVAIERPRRFAGPVALLIDARSFSAAEDMAAAFKLMKRGPVIGEASGGSTGQPLFIKLPGGGAARICIKRDSYPDGSNFVGVGVLPDIEVGPSVASVRAGSDPVLERALATLARLASESARSMPAPTP